MIEILPNWHPIFVHFTVALLLISALFHIAVIVTRNAGLKLAFTHVANWNLWVGAVLSVATVIAGWIAYNTVNHDTPSHLAMIEHRNWAMVTFAAFLAVGAWSINRAVKSRPIHWPLVIVVCAAGGLLITTAWHGGELVFRHGLGVMSLPNPDTHAHGEGAAHDHAHDSPAAPADHPHDDGHDHSHEAQEPAAPESVPQAAPEAGAQDSEAPAATKPESGGGTKSDHTHAPGQEPHEH